MEKSGEIYGNRWTSMDIYGKYGDFIQEIGKSMKSRLTVEKENVTSANTSTEYIRKPRAKTASIC